MLIKCSGIAVNGPKEKHFFFCRDFELVICEEISCLRDKQLSLSTSSEFSLRFTPSVCLKTSKIEPPQKLCLDTSPLEWTVTDVVRFIRTTDCAPLARIFLDQVRNHKGSIWNCILLMLYDLTSFFCCLGD